MHMHTYTHNMHTHTHWYNTHCVYILQRQCCWRWDWQNAWRHICYVVLHLGVILQSQMPPQKMVLPLSHWKNPNQDEHLWSLQTAGYLTQQRKNEAMVWSCTESTHWYHWLCSVWWPAPQTWMLRDQSRHTNPGADFAEGSPELWRTVDLLQTQEWLGNYAASIAI